MNCRYCEKEFPEDELVAVGAVGAEGEVACKSCEELHTGQCESCDKVLDMGCLVSVNDGSTLLCRGCMEVEAYECEWCEHLYTEAYSHRTADINCCEACTDRHYFWCDSCDGYYCIDDSGDHDHDNEYSEGEGTWEAPYSYDYEPCWEFHRAPHEQDTSTYFGVDLESSVPSLGRVQARRVSAQRSRACVFAVFAGVVSRNRSRTVSDTHEELETVQLAQRGTSWGGDARPRESECV